MKKKEKIGRGYKAAAIVLLLCGLTACANPLTKAVETALNDTKQTTEGTIDDNIEIRELKLRKIEPDSYAVQESSEEIEDESVPLESMMPE